MSDEFAWIRKCSVHLHVPNTHLIPTGAVPKLNELTNKSKESEMNKPDDEPPRCSSLDSPVPIQTFDEKSTDLECGDWLLSIHRPNLPNAKEEKCCSVTLTDPSHEQLTSRPSSAFHRRDQTLSYLMRLRRGFCRLIHPFLFLQIFANEFRVKMAGPFTIRND